MPYKKYYPKPYYNKKSLNWDKILVNNSGALTGNTQSNTLLYTAEEAGVLKGLRVNGAIRDTATASAPHATGSSRSLRKDTLLTQSTPAMVYSMLPNKTSGHSVLVLPHSKLPLVTLDLPIDVSPKTKRRMKKGDKLYLSIICTQNASAIITTQAFFGQ